ncbi:MAG: UDP-N-acetylglucosamine 2-epimerase [Sulfurimonas sp.]|uniref:UDP-N-acetylglucosamine 2-epimerase n=1 Tax=Sulfurimonas sp. TaxID=2022749 RepID=UPI0025FC5DAA|nr:UDP-N-acetylglucosamine 2-epimerase [Sulfurimonas sp.]MCK9491401.1 UDP-N-acetylglucosamine 2-epimerase [Sulfurimonas sp.]
MSKKNIVFLTGTRADFGKLKSLIKITQESDKYDVHIFATGMHMNSKYGSTVDEIQKSGFKNIYKFINHDTVEHMDRTLAKTIDGFSHYIAEIKPDLIVVHGDRVEALAGAIVGSLNNILVTHIEGGEISGTIDELIRHAVSKMSHIHLVANKEAKKRLLQLGEIKESIHVIGSPDLDLMNPKHLPSLCDAKKYYEIEFKEYVIAMFHPVTTEYKSISQYSKNFVGAMIESNLNYIVIYPNNDLGSNEILSEYEQLKLNKRFKIFPSLRFEYFLTILRNAKFIIGNSSGGIREAPFYNVPTIDIGTRQLNRAKIETITNCGYSKEEILSTIKKTSIVNSKDNKLQNYFGDGKSDIKFLDLLESNKLWNVKHQKQFKELGLI